MNNYEIVIYLLVIWFVASGAYRLWQAVKKNKEVGSLPQRLRKAWPSFLIPLAVFCIATSILYGAKLFFGGRLLIAIITLACSLVIAAIFDMLSTIKIQYLMKYPQWKLSLHFAAMLMGLSAIIFVIMLKSIPGNNKHAINLDFPVQGEWRVATGGRFAITNYHHDNPPVQNYAIDIVRTQGSSEGESIYAPLNGLVVKTVKDRWPGSTEAEGNIIIIKSDDDVLVCMAHLQQGSVLAKVGERVERGDQLAKCGETGSAESTHLHIHAERDGKAIPMLFGKRNNWLMRNDIFHN